jgi:hypothetical protein
MLRCVAALLHWCAVDFDGQAASLGDVACSGCFVNYLLCACLGSTVKQVDGAASSRTGCSEVGGRHVAATSGFFLEL